MKNLLKIQVLLIAVLFFFIGNVEAQTYTPDVSKGKTAIWDYGGGGFGGEFNSFNKTNFQANVVSYGNSWYGTHQNTSRRGITPSGGPGMVWEPGQVVMHPGKHQTENTKIKFTAPSDGTYEISAKWTNLQACAKKTWAWIYTNAPDAGGKFYNGSPRGYNNIFTQGAQGQNKSVSHKQTFKMTKGQVITFEVGNGLDGWGCDSMGAEIEVKKVGSSLKVGAKHLGGTIISLSGRGGVIVSDEIKDVCITNVNQKVGALGRGWASPKIEDLEAMAKVLPANSFSGEYMSVSHKGSNYYWGYNMTGKRRTAVFTNDCKKVTRAVKRF